MPLARTIALLLSLLVAAAPALAWGPSGHEIVGNLAQTQLRPAARTEVARLLAGEAAPTLAGVSKWADDVRDAGLGDRRTAKWHFVNFKGGDCTYVPPRDCPDGNCVIAAINRNFLALADRKRPDDERRDALKFLVHLIADVHQPLHASANDDRGGNDFQVAYHGQGRNLHSVWDGLLINRTGMPAAEYAQWLDRQSPLPPDPTRRSDRPAVDWALESCRLVREPGFYPSSHVIDDQYLDGHRALVEQRLRRAGSRLADMINYALDPRATSASR